jgi:dihydrolipoamide dehydrogenase
MPQLLPGVDREIARKLENSYKKKGITVHTSTDATAVPLENFELVLLCIGRAIFTQQMGLERIGLKTEKGKIIVDEYLRTNAQNIFAAGDCTGKLMLAHFAAYQGNIAARNIAHPDDLIKADNTTIPSCIFTDPEIASVGLSEEDVRAAGIEVEVNKFDFLGSGMARILDETEGFI